MEDGGTSWLIAIAVAWWEMKPVDRLGEGRIAAKAGTPPREGYPIGGSSRWSMEETVTVR
jgi:hypothetical protein